MEDLFDNTRDRWQKSYRQPLYQRLLFLVGIAIVVAAALLQARIRELIAGDPRAGWALVGGIALVTLGCWWVSIRAWECKILISPTSLKAWYLFRGRERISWDSMDRVVCKWRLIGHTLLVFGTDGARVRLRSSLRGYDQVIGFIRAKAPQHIIDQLDEALSDEEDEERGQEAPAPDAAHEDEPDEPAARKDDAAS